MKDVVSIARGVNIHIHHRVQFLMVRFECEELCMKFESQETCCRSLIFRQLRGWISYHSSLSPLTLLIMYVDIMLMPLAPSVVDTNVIKGLWV